MIHALTAALTDGQFWALSIMGALIVAQALGVVACIAERMMGDRA